MTRNEENALASVVALAVLMFGMGWALRKSPPQYEFLAGARPWFAEHWNWDPRNPGPYTDAYVLNKDFGEVRRAARRHREIAWRGAGEHLECSLPEGHGTLEIMSVRELHSLLVPTADYPQLQAGTATVYWVMSDAPPWDVRFRAWLYRLLWRGSVP